MPVKITQFEAENIKRIKAMQVIPAESGLTIIGGRNNQGKSSVLDAIMWALGGDRYRPSQAQREGSVIPPVERLTLSNGVTVERSGKNSDLKVTDASGHRAGQQLLNSFVEQLALDMPRFMQAPAREKADTLLQIIGLEDQVKELERQEKELYNQRRTIGRIADQKAKYARELPSFPDTPNQPISAYDLIQRQQDILARNGENQRKPWDCMSGSDQLKASAAIVRALKPECGFMLLDKLEQVKAVRDGPGLCATLVLDTADWAEQLCINSICAAKKLSGIEDMGYGKGYVYLAEEFGRLLNLLEEVVGRGVNVVLTAHAMMRKFEQPDELGAYDRWELKLQKKTAPLVKEWSDVLLFANYKTQSVAADNTGKKFKAQGGRRVIYTAHHPCWTGPT